jgi:hypothetical protein
MKLVDLPGASTLDELDTEIVAGAGVPMLVFPPG